MHVNGTQTKRHDAARAASPGFNPAALLSCISVQVVAVGPTGNRSPVSAAVPVTTPAAAQPVVAATPTSPTTATVVITPPATGGPYPSYNVTLCPASGTGACVKATCTDPTNCPVTGLQPGTTYTTTVSGKAGCMPHRLLLI